MPVDWFGLRTGGAFSGALARSLLPQYDELPGLESGQRVGPFVIVRELARGGMARVYLAERGDGEFSQRVALKWMAPSSDEPALEAMFRRERDILASLEHPGIARLLDGGRLAGGMLWFAMELVEGEPLDAWCERRGLSQAARIDLLLELCAALAFAHARLLVHRDIKPANVLVAADGRVRLLDFGIARLLDQNDLSGNFALTPGFASPEQLRGETVTVASDVYQVGLLLALLLEVLPRKADAAHATLTDAGATGAGPVPLEGRALAVLPDDLAAIIDKATALEPQARYGGVDALADDLRRYRAHRPVLAHDGGAVYRIGCLLRRQPLASALVAAAAIGLVGAAVVANLGRLEARRAQVQAQRSERTALATTDFLVSVFRAPDPRANPGLDLTARELLARGVDGIGGLDAEPAVQVRLLDAFGQVTAALGAYDRSEALLQDAIEIYARKQLDEPLRLAALRNQLGQVQSDRDNLGAAEGSFRQALAELQSAGLAESAQAAELHSNLGVALRRQGRIDEAVVEYRQSIAMGERIVAPGQYSVLLNLGALELSRGRHADALQWLRQAAAAFPADLPENHPSRSVLHTNIAVAARNLGHLGEALAHAQRADAIDRVALGADHPDRAPTMQGLAVAQWRLGEREAAIATLQDALAVLDAALGPGHPRSALLWRTLAMLQIDAGDLPAARGSVQRADVAMRDAPPAQAGRGRVLNRLCEAELERRAGRFDPAALAAQTALDAAQALALPNDAALAAQLSALIALDAGRGDLARARWHLAQELAGCVSGRCVLDSPERLQLRAQWLARQGEFERAFAVLDAALGDAGWTAGMLALPGLEGMHGDPRWPGLQQKLASRMAVDGTPPGQAR